MPKRLHILLVIVSALLVSVLPLRAQPSVDELLRFADEAPFNAVAFGAIRTDSAYIETLDGVIAQITSTLPSDLLPPGLSLSAVLDLASSQITGQSFSQGLRPILGDVIGFAVGDLGAQIDNTWYNDDQVPLAVYVAISDATAAEELVGDLLLQMSSADDLTITETPAGTLFSVDLNPIVYFLVRADALIIATTPEMLPNDGASLIDNPYFQSAVGSLPAESYNIIGYIDAAYLGSAIVGSDRRASADARIAQMLIFRSLGVVAGGATILNGTTLTGDVVLSPGNLQPLESFGIDVQGAPEPINGALLSRIPADSALVWHGTYPLGALDLVDRSVSGAIEVMSGSILDVDPMARAAYEAVGESLLYWPNAILTNLGGLTFEDYAEWLQGDYIVALRPNLDYLPRSPGLPFDGGIILEAANPSSARERMLRFARELTLMLRAGSLPRNASIIPVQTRIGDADAVVLRAVVEDFSLGMVSYIDFAIAADDQVMVIGTLDFVEEVLGNANADSSPFDADQGVLLPESRLALYVNPRALTTMALPLFGYNFDFDRPRIQLPLLALTLFDSSTASLTFDEPGNTVMRFTLTLAEDQAANAAAATATYEAFAATADALFQPPPTFTPFPTATETPFAVPTSTPFPMATETPFATPSMVRSITVGETITGNLAAGARDSYLLIVPARATYVIDLEAEFDTFLELFDQNNAVVTINDDRGDGTLNSRITTELSAGIYTIIARSFANTSTGDYTLSVGVDAALAATPTPTAAPSVAGVIAVGQTITGNLAAGARDSYAITVPAGAVITIDMEADFDTFLELRDNVNFMVANNDDRGDGTFNSRIVTSNLAAGTYTIIARGYSTGGSGPYTLSVSAGAVVPPTATIVPTAAPSAAGTIAVDETITGNLAAGARDSYAITVPAGAVITIDMEADFDTFLELRDDVNFMVANNDDRGDGTLNSRIVTGSLAAGTYTIIARGYSTSESGPYTLSVSGGAAAIQPTAAPSSTEALVLGAPISGTIARAGNAAFTLTLDASTALTFDLNSPDFDTVIEVFDTNNSRVGYNDDAPGRGTNSLIENQTFAPGTYRVVVRSFGDVGGGAFTLVVSTGTGGGGAGGVDATILPFAATATALIQEATAIALTAAAPTAVPMTITVGQTVTATLSRGQRNQYTFTAAAGDIVTIDMEAPFDTYLRLLDASGRMIAENDDRGDGTYNSRIRSFAVPAAGTYTISAGSFADAGDGEYTLTLARG